LITLLERWLFPATRGRVLMCNCGTCIVSGVAIVIAVAINVQQFFSVGWSTLSWISLVAVVVLAVVCRIVSRRNVCAQPSSDTETTEQPTV
jgi:membrane protein YdbS with pleckstrin-like domain